jgi:nucleotide-binding universal stress UspA family protein
MFRKLLVPLDGSELAEQALGQAAAIARASDSQLDLILVQEPALLEGTADASRFTAEQESERRYLQSTANELSTGTGVPVTCALVVGPKVDMICERAFDIDADLIVMTSHGRTGLSRAWLGSVADGVMRLSSVPVLMLRPVETKADRLAARHLFKHILVPLDGSPLGAESLAAATELAKCSGASITLLRVVVEVPLVLSDAGVPFVFASPIISPDAEATARLVEVAKAELEPVARSLTEQGVSDVQYDVVVGGQVAPAIIEFARGHGIDVIAMSTHGRGASRLFVGSVVDKVIRGSELPMLVYHPASTLTKAAREHASTFRIPMPALAPV